MKSSIAGMNAEEIKEFRSKRNRVRNRHFGTACGILAGFCGGLVYLLESVRVVVPMIAFASGAIVAYTSVWLGNLEDRLVERIENRKD